MKSILMILPRFYPSGIYDKQHTGKNYDYMFPLGMAYISSFLKANGVDVTCLNLNHRQGIVSEILKETISAKHYDFVFTGGLTISYPGIRDIVQDICKFSSDTTIVVGGGIMSSQPEIMFDLLKPDYGIIGEGELVALDLIQGSNNIDGLVFKFGGALLKTEPRASITDLDALPFPDYEGFGIEEYLNNITPGQLSLFDIFDIPRPYLVLASRSCPFNCTFCYHPLGQKYRQRSIDNIMEEISTVVKKYQINLLIFYDELFAKDPVRVEEFCRRLTEFQKTIPWEIKWCCALRVDYVTDDLLKQMKDSGCYMICPGLESYSQTVLTSMKKHITPEQINRAVQLIRNNQIGLQGTFIFGDTAETKDTAKETLDYYRNNIDIIQDAVGLGFIHPFPGSEIYKVSMGNGLIKDEYLQICNREEKGLDFFNPQKLTSSLSDDEFAGLVDEVLIATHTTGHFVILNGRMVVCPYCGYARNVHKSLIPTGFSAQPVGCLKCYGRFKIVTRYHVIMRFLIKYLGFKNTSNIKNYFFPSVGDFP